LLGVKELYTDIANFVEDANYISAENKRAAGITPAIL
jgi:hypothetical protein